MKLFETTGEPSVEWWADEIAARRKQRETDQIDHAVKAAAKKRGDAEAQRSAAALEASAPPLVVPDLTRAPDVNIGEEFTPEDINAACVSASNGDPRQLYGIFEETERFGTGPAMTKVRESLSGAERSVLAWPEEFQDDDAKGADADLARACRDYIDEQLDPHLQGAIEGGAGVFPFGIAALNVRIKRGGATGLRDKVVRIDEVPQRRFRLDWFTQEWFLYLDPHGFKYEPIQQYVDRGELVFMEIGRGAKRLDKRGLLRQCLIPWSLATFGIRWWGRWMELYSIPYRDVTYDKSDPNAKNIAKEIALKSGAAGFSAHPKSITIEFLQALASAGSVSTHRELVDWADRWYDRVFHGHSQASSVQEGAGSRTSAQNADQQSIRLAMSRARFLETSLREQLIKPLILRNFGEEALPFAPKLSIAVRAEENVKEFSESVLNLQRAGATNISEPQSLKRVGLRMARKGEPRLRLPVAATTVPFDPEHAAELDREESAEQDAATTRIAKAAAKFAEGRSEADLLATEERAFVERLGREVGSLLAAQNAEAEARAREVVRG